ncbi:LacI family transcriptional regulator [Leifsonia shinshuensis]|uniref:LacI family transcriptional regulator n=2 Tax=Leifsonia shinshuensis TaxID=150026 RepID=A0A7G6YGN2_9MICO|nr:LacI family transcriptional regulator [Leifsonia shinshuensis]
MSLTKEGGASLADVAKLANVSQATASKALNAKIDVSQATRARVEDAARELGYVPNTLARGLMNGRTGTVGVITSDLDGRFALPILMGVEDALGSDKVFAFLCDARGDDVREQTLLNALIQRRVEGVIIVGNQTDLRPSLGRDLGLPIVYAYAMSEDPEDVSVTVDNYQVGQIAAQHLIYSGRRRIAHISGEAPHSAARKRLEGIVDTLAENKMELVGTPLFGDWSEGWGRAATAMVLDRDEPIDAILCGSDQIARGALDTLRERGIDVPGQIAVMGVDNWTLLAANSRPSLTTVDLNLERLGRTAAQRLYDPDFSSNAGIEYLPCSVVIRDSTIPRL